VVISGRGFSPLAETFLSGLLLGLFFDGVHLIEEGVEVVGHRVNYVI
jgi:hypothetical protein